MEEILGDPQFTSQERGIFRTFYDCCVNRAKSGVKGEEYVFDSIANEANINVHLYYKEGVFMQALWVLFLLVLKDNITEEDFKYKTLEEFLASYPGAFDTLDEKEKNNLWHTANWMVLLFQMIPARKNKGLAIHVCHL